jgi:pyruvate carboxylase
VKVTPSSKVVGDLALALVGAGVSADEFASDPARFDIPDSVIGFLRGELGDPPAGWPEPLRTKALAGRSPARSQQELTAEDEVALATPGLKRQATLEPAAVPRSDKGIRGAP